MPGAAVPLASPALPQTSRLLVTIEVPVSFRLLTLLPHGRSWPACSPQCLGPALSLTAGPGFPFLHYFRHGSSPVWLPTGPAENRLHVCSCVAPGSQGVSVLIW